MECVIKTHEASYPTNAEFPERLSVAVSFIDRHFDEGHVGKNLIRGSLGDEPYFWFADAKENSDQLIEELFRFCKTVLAGYKYHWSINFVEKLPKMAIGKIQRF
jgi:acyl-coenzyme A synthetase/AMP-(fatty) acid ligase